MYPRPFEHRPDAAQSERPASEPPELAHGIGQTALSDEPGDEPSVPDAPNVFVALTQEEFFQSFRDGAAERGFNLAELRPEQRHGFVQFAHTTIYNYHLAKHTHEWNSDVEAAEPPPLLGRHVRQRITAFCTNPSIKQWNTDSIHARKLDELHAEFNPIAELYRDKIPEIGEAYALVACLKAKGNEDASEMLEDLIAVYGQVMQGLMRSAAKMRRDRAEAESRRNQY